MTPFSFIHPFLTQLHYSNLSQLSTKSNALFHSLLRFILSLTHSLIPCYALLYPPYLSYPPTIHLTHQYHFSSLESNPRSPRSSTPIDGSSLAPPMGRRRPSHNSYPLAPCTNVSPLNLYTSLIPTSLSPFFHIEQSASRIG